MYHCQKFFFFCCNSQGYFELSGYIARLHTI
uniref:Uncharacterized protein n=1 Tax=Anguilla anguilla TaxID=7936 RepID=A0A0E9W9U0_ANGAN